MIRLIYILIPLFYFSCDFCPDWTDEEKENFAIECSNSPIIENLNIQLYGYNIQKNDSILIIEKFRGIIIDSFLLQ